MSDSPAEPLARIEQVVADFVGAVTRADVSRREVERRLDDVGQLGAREISATTLIAARIAERSSDSTAAAVGERLAELREAVEGRRSRRQRKRVHEIVGGLQDARARIEQANAALAQDGVALASALEGLRQYGRLADRLDEECTSRAAATDVIDAVRHRRDAIAMHVSVAEQADAALHVMMSSNEKLIRGIGVATTTTIAALDSSDSVTNALSALDEVEAVAREAQPPDPPS
jgi:hypothetical protein